jgi:hypothetical protein
MRKPLEAAFVALFAAGVFAACGSDDEGTAPPVQLPPPAPTPTPTPSPTPEPGPARPTAGNTGFPRGVSLRTWSGSQYDGRSNLIIDGYELPRLSQGYYTFAGDNVILRNCRINSGILFSGDNVRLERCEVIGGVSLSGTDQATIAYNNIHDIPDDGLHVTSDSGPARRIEIAHNLVHGFVYTPAIACSDPHSDGIQVRGVDGLTLFNNVFDMGRWQSVCNGRSTPLNAAIFLQDANGGNRNVRVDRNYLNGGAIVARIGPGPNMSFTSNRFGRDERYGLVENLARPGDIIDRSGNVRDDTGEPVDF